MPPSAEILVKFNEKEMHYKLLCAESLHHKKKEKKLMVFLDIGFHFFINTNETVVNHFFFNSFWS